MKFWNTQLRLLILFQNKDENSLVSSVKMLSESQTVEEQTEIPNEIMSEKPSEPHRSIQYWSRKFLKVNNWNNAIQTERQQSNSRTETSQNIVGYTFYQNKHNKILGIWHRICNNGNIKLGYSKYFLLKISSKPYVQFQIISGKLRKHQLL